MNRQKTTKHSEPDMAKVHWSEWLAGGVSGVLIVALLGWLAYHCYQYTPEKADFRVEITDYTAANNGYRVAFSVTNLSQSSAAQVRVIGTFGEEGQTEQATTTFDYVASEARSAGALFFENDPRDHDLKLRVASYIEP